MFKENNLKKKLKSGKTVFGCWAAGGSLASAEILGHAGFDFLLFDHEHGGGETAEITSEMRIVETTPTSSVVRVPWNDHVFIKRILDAGVQNIMIPQVENAAEAREAVAACLYPPYGRRGYAAPVVRASTFGLEPDYIHKANDNILTIIQIESANAVENIDEICAVEGLDCIFIGINDLSGSINMLEKTGAPEVLELVEKIEKAVLKSGKILASLPSSGLSADDLIERGYTFIVGPHEVALLRDAAIGAVSTFLKKTGSKARNY